MKCPKCGSEDVRSDLATSIEHGVRQCYECPCVWTDWQQSLIDKQAGENERLKADLEKTESLLHKSNEMVREARKERDETRASLAHATEIIREIREHEHCKLEHVNCDESLVPYVLRNFASGMQLGHRCAASIASRFTGENPYKGMRERFEIAERIISLVMAADLDAAYLLSEAYRAKFPKEES